MSSQLQLDTSIKCPDNRTRSDPVQERLPCHLSQAGFRFSLSRSLPSSAGSLTSAGSTGFVGSHPWIFSGRPAVFHVKPMQYSRYLYVIPTFLINPCDRLMGSPVLNSFCQSKPTRTEKRPFDYDRMIRQMHRPIASKTGLPRSSQAPDTGIRAALVFTETSGPAKRFG